MNVYKFIPEQYIDESVYIHMDILQSCYDAMDEGVLGQDLAAITKNNTTSLALTYLNATYKRLCQMHDIFVSHLNNYILNYSKLAEKYKALIIDMYSKINEPIIYNTYTYPKINDKFPRPISGNSKWHTFVRESSLFSTDDKTERDEVSVYFNIKVDEMLQDYTKDVLGEKLNTNKLAEETKFLVNKRIKGIPKTIGITQRNVGDLLNNFSAAAKDVLKEIKTTKSGFSKDYKTLQELLGLYQNKKVPLIQSISMLREPEKYQLELQEMKRFSSVNMEMGRLYTGLVTVYNVAYITKYEALRERIELDRTVLVALLQAAGSFAAINNKTATKQSQPLKKS